MHNHFKLLTMNKLLLTISIVLFAFSGNAQFKATKDGIALKNGETYCTFEIKGKTAKEIYEAVNSYIISHFKNPDAVANKQENTMINLHGVFPDAFVCKRVFGIDIYAEVDMNIVMYFKDGKIRFDIPIINSMYYNDEDQVVFSGGVNIAGDGDINMFKKNGKPNKEDVIKSFEEFINNTIKDIIDYINKEENVNW